MPAVVPAAVVRHVDAVYTASDYRFFLAPKRGNLVLAQGWVRHPEREQGPTGWTFTVYCARRSRHARPRIGRAVQAYTATRAGETVRQHWTMRLAVPHWARTRRWARGRCSASVFLYNAAQPTPTNDPGLRTAIFFLAPPR